MNIKITKMIFQSAIGIVFGYFGILALINPEVEAAKWISVNITSLVEVIVPVSIFMLALGATQVIISFLLIINRLTHIALPLAALLLLGIIINLGFNEISLRDFVILTGVVYLYFLDRQPLTIKKD